jgi:hypothetical protein
LRPHRLSAPSYQRSPDSKSEPDSSGTMREACKTKRPSRFEVGAAHPQPFAREQFLLHSSPTAKTLRQRSSSRLNYHRGRCSAPLTLSEWNRTRAWSFFTAHRGMAALSTTYGFTEGNFGFSHVSRGRQ